MNNNMKYIFKMNDNNVLFCNDEKLYYIRKPTHVYTSILELYNNKILHKTEYTDYDYETESFYEAGHSIIPDEVVKEAIEKLNSGQRKVIISYDK